jgi:hypothetical protein
MQSSYVSLLNDKLKILGHFADQALQATSEYDFFRLLCLNFIPCIKRMSSLEDLLGLWENNLRDHHHRWKKSEKEAIQQVTDTFNLIKQRLLSKHVFEDQEIIEKFISVERILNGEERICLQPHYEIANDRIQSLLHLLFDKGEREVLTDLVNITYPNENDKKVNPAAKPFIHSFLFSPAILDLNALNKKKSKDNFHDAWIVWDNLCLAQWCWMHGEEYFQRQELAYESIKACAKSSFLIELHSVYCDMYAIRERRKTPREISFFSQKQFKEYLKIVMNHILLFQEELKFGIKQENRIYALGLNLDQNQLYLSVECTKDQETSCYLLHTFHEKSAQLEILRPFLINEHNKTVSLSERSSGNNSTKYLSRIGLTQELKSIFVESTSKDSISFRGKYIELSSLPSINQMQLIQQIEQLPHIG